MKRLLGKGLRSRMLLVAALLLVSAVSAWIVFLAPSEEPWWSVLRRESRRILGGNGGDTPPEEKRIREEVILKKMQEASAQRDWRDFAPEYPRLKKIDKVDEKERRRILKESPELKEVERDLKETLIKKEDSLNPELPLPSLKEATDLSRLRDKGSDKVMERLLSTKEKPNVEKVLEENVQLGIKGPLASRKILERPPPPQVRVDVEAEIELTLWVLPNGTVDRVIPLVKGDAGLERIAIQYVKQWRFASLARDQNQVEEWGTVPIKFRLQ